jgi:DNA repair exonuclease SbcCD nuclease subunit
MAPARLIAIGDIHLKPGPKQADVLAALDQILDREIGGPEDYFLPNVTAWLLLGDLFHTRSSIEDRNQIAPRLQRMANLAPVVLLAGNHDAPGDLEVFGRLQACWPIHVVTAPRTVFLEGAAMPAIFCLPYPVKAGLVAAGVTHQDLRAAACQALDVIFIHAAAELEAARKEGRPTLMIGHANIVGAVASNGQPQVGVEISVDESMLMRLGHIPKIFGHIHKAQEIAGAFYAGSICRLDFGETEEKRYLGITFGQGDEIQEGATDADGWLYDVQSHQLDVAPMYHVDGHLTRSSFEWSVTKGPGGEAQPAPTSWKGCEVRCRYRYQQSEKTVLSQAQILATFAEAKRLELEPIAVPDRALRAPEVAAATTLQDKFKAYCDLGGSPATPGTLEKLALLEHKDPAQVLSYVATDVARIETPQEEAVLV